MYTQLALQEKNILKNYVMKDKINIAEGSVKGHYLTEYEDYTVVNILEGYMAIVKGPLRLENDNHKKLELEGEYVITPQVVYDGFKKKYKRVID